MILLLSIKYILHCTFLFVSLNKLVGVLTLVRAICLEACFILLGIFKFRNNLAKLYFKPVLNDLLTG